MDNYDVYNDIRVRTGGDIYIGVVGPVRSGKSTFIKRFMELVVIPGTENENEKMQMIDELPQSASGKTIMTTEPKFIPKKAAIVDLSDECYVNVRLIDCVGFMTPGAQGHIENEHERIVMTPWFSEGLPFSQAAEIGTRKVITDHSTIGIVITTDGSIGELEREAYIEPENKTIAELKAIGKPFIVVLNTNRPYSAEAKNIAREISDSNNVVCIPINCDQLKREDVNNILHKVLLEFPINKVDFYMPKWVEMLDNTHPLKRNLIENVKKIFDEINVLNDVRDKEYTYESEYIKGFDTLKYSPENGSVSINITFDDSYYYNILSDLTGIKIDNEYCLISTLKELAAKRDSLISIGNAYDMVNSCGYGVVEPAISDVCIEEPEIIKHGSKYGVKIKAVSSSIHLIAADIETEIAPIVGTKEQAEDLIKYISENEAADTDGILDTNIFGKTIRQLVEEGIHSKIGRLSEDSKQKLKDTIQKVINDSNGGLVCIII